MSNNSFFIGSFILTAIWLNIDLIFHILPNGSTYAAAKYVVLFLSFAQLTIATFNATISVLNFSRYYVLSLRYSFILTVSAIYYNNLLIPYYGMNGAALANLLSYLLYFALMLITLALCNHTHPFCRNQLKTLFLLILLLTSGTLFDYAFPNLNIWLASGIKTTVWVLALVTAYFWTVSPEINQTIKEKLRA